MPTADISDVTGLINTNLSDQNIANALQYAQELNQEYNSESNQTNTQTKNIERFAAIAYIRQHLERSVEEDAVGDASAAYEGSELANAKAQLRSWINQAGGDTAMVGALTATQRDDSRHTTSKSIGS